MRNVMSALGGFAGKPGEGGEQSALVRSAVQRSAPVQAVANIPLPPARPADLGPPAAAPLQLETVEASGKPILADPAAPGIPEAPASDLEASSASVRISEAPPPGAPPAALSYSYRRQTPPYRLPEIITGSQPILPPGFQAYAELRR
jgi:hypothetical protein